MVLATENRRTPHAVAASSALSRPRASARRYSTGSARSWGAAARCTTPVIACRFPMSRKAASSAVSNGSTTTRPLGSSARNSGSRVERWAVSTTDSPRSSTARAVCAPMDPRPPVMMIMIATLGRCRLPLLYETAVHGPEHRGVKRGVVVSAGARGAGLREELAGLHAHEPAALAAQVRLVVVARLDGPPREVAVGGALPGDRRLDAGDEGLEP